MTTLRRERVQKFREIIREWVGNSPAIISITGNNEIFNVQIEKLAESLADASISRSEQEAELGHIKATDIPSDKPIIKGIEYAIFEGRPIIQADIDPAKNEHNALVAFETAFGITNGRIAWYGVKKEWTRLRKFLTDLHLKDSDCFKKYRAWYDSTGKFKKAYGVMDLKRDPDGFALSWDMFISEVGNSNQTERPEHQKFVPEDNSQFVPFRGKK